MEEGDDADRPVWNDDDAQGLITSTILIGVTHMHPDGPVQEQMFGKVIAADAARGFAIALEGQRAGQIYWLPPDLNNFHAAAPGAYTLRSTGETVTDPDYTATWTVHPRQLQ